MSDAARLMDRIYGQQRHIYDVTRKFYLLGRDGLICDLAPEPGARILEIGCGTGRNLAAIAKRYPGVRCYGIDISAAMLATARANIAKVGIGERIHLAAADATCFDPQALFGIAAFDRIVLSYTLSMIPPWRDVLHQGARLLAPSGTLHVVDFGDQANLPRAFKALLETWLAWFHVTPRATLADEIARIAGEQGLLWQTRSRFRGYAVSAELARR